MTDLPTDWSALCALVFLLGLRHGVDADHLAAIDGLSRLSLRRRAAHARWCGLLFSLGHGAVVMAVALGAGLASLQWRAPAWLEWLGAWISIVFLLLLGLMNLRAVWQAAPEDQVSLVPLRGRWLGVVAAPLGRARGPGGAAAVGALFALSLDTLSQALLFALLGTRFGGVEHALALGALFTAGMLLSDTVGGWWMTRLFARADQRAARASRILGLSVAAVSLAVAALGIARLLSNGLDGWWSGRELWISAAVLAAIAAGYLAACAPARRPRLAQAGGDAALPTA